MDEKGETEEGTKGGRVGMESIERKIGIEENERRGSKKKRVGGRGSGREKGDG